MTRAVPSLPEKVTLDATDELLVSDISAGVSKKVKAENIASGVDKGNLSGELISADADNEIVQGSDSKLYTSSPVQTVHGRAGDVVSANGDYTASQVTNAFDKTADTTDDVTEGVTNLYNVVPAGGTLGQVLQKVDGTDYNLQWASATVANATETVAGVVELATDAEVLAETATGGTGASLVATPANMKQHNGIAKAWVNFNGQGTVAIRDSYNVSSITDNGTGDYTVNFTSNFANTNYCVTASLSQVYGSAVVMPMLHTTGAGAESAPTVGSFRMSTEDSAGGQGDVKYINVQVFGDI